MNLRDPSVVAEDCRYVRLGSTLIPRTQIDAVQTADTVRRRLRSHARFTAAVAKYGRQAVLCGYQARILASELDTTA